MLVESDIGRVEVRSSDEMRAVLASRTPAVIRGVVEHWPAARRWSSAHFRDQHGDAIVHVHEWTKRDLSGIRFRPMSLRTYVTEHFEKPFDHLHLGGHSMAGGELGALRRDLPPIAGVPELAPDQPLLFLSPKGAVTSLHYDICDNLYAQISGIKQFSLVVGARRPRRRVSTRWWWTSDLDLEDRAHPRTRDLRVRQVELVPGDLLYVPGGHWHQVRTIEPSIAVGHFFEYTFAQKVVRTAARLLGRPTT